MTTSREIRSATDMVKERRIVPRKFMRLSTARVPTLSAKANVPTKSKIESNKKYFLTFDFERLMGAGCSIFLKLFAKLEAHPNYKFIHYMTTYVKIR